MASELIQGHLRAYVNASAQQKVRLENTVIAYQEQLDTTKERIIDQLDLLDIIKQRDGETSQFQEVKARTEKDMINRIKLEEIVTDSRKIRNEHVDQIQAHLVELAELEITTGGFIAHPIGVDEKAKYDPTTNVVTFSELGHIEIPIATRLDKWKDSSQMSIIRKLRV